jgi:hypothetical protein
MGTTIQLRRDTQANWEAVNPVLAQGEMGLQLGTPIKIKIGNGSSTWSALPFLETGTGTGTATNGLSAYEVAVANGFVGTLAQWLTSLRGADGASAYAVAVANGFQGTQQQWLASLIGADGAANIDGIVAGLATKVLRSTVVVLTVAGNAVSWDASQGSLYRLTLTADATLQNPTNAVAGAIYQIEVNQDNAGLRVLNWGTNYKFPNNSKPIISLDSNAVDIVTIYTKSATELLVTYVQNFI